LRRKQERIQEQLQTKIAEKMDAVDRRSRFKKEGEEDRSNVNQDLLVRKLDKQIKNLKTANERQKQTLGEQLELSQNANIVMKRQCQLLQKQLESQMKQSEDIIESQKKEIGRLLDSNINHGIKLLHKDFKQRMEVLKDKKKEEFLDSLTGYKAEMNKLKADEKRQREQHIQQMKTSKLPLAASNLASLK